MPLQVKVIHTYEDHIPDFYQTRVMRAKYVSDALRDEYENWNSRDPIMIDAPTGSGKNTFIINELIPRAKQLKKNILIISNRIALSIQQKILIMKALNSPWLELLTDRGIIETNTFDNVKIITYQSLPTFLEDENCKVWCDNLMYVIADEAHFFAADSLFNESCGYILDQLVRNFTKAIRIYLTATSWDILYPISQVEQTKYRELVKNNTWQPPRVCVRYYFPPDFSNITLNFIDCIEDLPEMIESNNEKWLIFIDNKEKGKALCNNLPGKCSYLDAQSKHSKIWKLITENECFESQVLVTTSVLDNGINIKDPKLKNVVVFSDSRTSLIQMLGRKRCSENEKINLWVCNINYNSAKKYYNYYKEMYRWYEEYDINNSPSTKHAFMTKLWHTEDYRLHILFYPYKGCLYQNNITRYAIERKIDFFKKIVENGIPFTNFVQRWLSKPQTIPTKHIDTLLIYCEANVGKLLSEEEKDILRQYIVKAYIEAKYNEPHKDRLDELQYISLNNRLEKLGIPYRIKDQNKIWIIVKYQEVGNDIS